jgi:hypothetical protein
MFDLTDRIIVYPGELPKSTDFLMSQVNQMVGLGYTLGALVGSGTYVTGLACTPTSPASLTVNVGPGAIIATSVVDSTAFGGVGANSAPLVKIGVNQTSTAFALAAPATSGQSINYLIEAIFEEVDGNPLELPYYNAVSPSTPYTGPGGNGVAQNTTRSQIVGLQLKAGAAATTGTQATPGTDAGWSPLYVVTVNHGQTTITAANITVAPAAPFLMMTLPQVPVAVPSGVLNLYLSPTGSDSNPGTSASAPLLTFAGAVAVLTRYQMGGLTAILNLVAGSYAGYNFNGRVTPCTINIVGAGSTVTTLIGTGGIFNATNANAVGAVNGASVSVSGVTLTATGVGGDYLPGGCGMFAGIGSSATIASDVTFGSCGGFHLQATQGGAIRVVGLGLNSGGPYKISGGAQCHIYTSVGGNVTVADTTITLVGTPAFSNSFIQSIYGGYVGYWGNTFVGSATGPRYLVANNGIVNTNGASVSYLPGNATGTNSNGLYV